MDGRPLRHNRPPTDLACANGSADDDAAHMNAVRNVLEFGSPYLRRYWGRLLCGVLCGMLFGAANSSFIWATRTITDRLTPPEARAEKQAKTEARAERHRLEGIAPSIKERLALVNNALNRLIDPWLPALGSEIGWQRILGGLLFLPLLVSFRSAADYFAGYCMGWVSERVINDLRADVLAKLTTLSLDYFNSSTTGDLLTRINADTMNLHRALRLGCGDLVKQPFTIVGVLCGMLAMDWKLTLFALVFLPVCLVPLIILGRKARLAGSAARKASVSQNSMLVELLTGIRVIKAFTLEDRELHRFRFHARQLVRHGMKGVQAKELVNPLIEVVSVFALAILVLYIFWTNQRVGDLVGFLTGLMLFYLPIKKLASIHVLFEQAMPGVERLMEIRAERPTVKETAHPKSLAAFTREIRFEQVSFHYGREVFALRELSLVIPRGSNLGIAGESGSGKSTLTNLLFRFYDPTEGRITLDGVDLREFTFVELRRHMALVSQDVVLFNMTVAENIACGKLDATRPDIEAAACAAYAHEFITQLPQGYDTPIGERGVTLSGGQRQRLAIARAFVRNAPILVLDEATASLDSQAEAEVQAAIDRLAENRTVISVAHRLSTLAAMDEIIVLAEGRMTERGTFQELLAAGGQFADMARRQGISVAATAAQKH